MMLNTIVDAGSSPAPALVWDRIQDNERKTRNLLTLFALLFIPFAMALVPVATCSVLILFPAREPSDLVAEWVLSGAVLGAIAAVALAAAISQYRNAGRLIFRRAGTKPVGDREPELRRIVEGLCIGAGLRTPAIHVIETDAPNAFTAGTDPNRAELAVTRGLLELLDPRELRGVIAHELSHIGNRDVRLGSVLTACLTVLRLPMRFVEWVGDGYAEFRRPTTGHYREGDRRENSLQAQMWFVVLSIAGAIVSVVLLARLVVRVGNIVLEGPFVKQLNEGLAIDISISAFYVVATGGPAFLLWAGQMLARFTGRTVLCERELLADADAFLLTRDAEGLACALAKIEEVDLPTPGSDAANAHLFLADPILDDTAWWNAPVMAHPPVAQRITALQALASFPPESLSRARVAAREWAVARGYVVAESDPDAAPPPRERWPDDVVPVYEAPDGWSRTVAQLAPNSEVTLVPESTSGRFIKIRTADGLIGYVSGSGRLKVMRAVQPTPDGAADR